MIPKVEVELTDTQLRTALKERLMLSATEFERNILYGEYEDAFTFLFMNFTNNINEFDDENFIRSHRLFVFLIPEYVEDYIGSKDGEKYEERFERLKYSCL